MKAPHNMKCKWVKNGEMSEMVWLLSDLLWALNKRLRNLLPSVCCRFIARAVWFSCSSLVAGDLASGQHAHNPHQNSSHHFIFPVLRLSLASVCKYGNSACECHWWPVMKISLWLPQMGKTGALDKSSNIYLRDKRGLNYFSCKLMSSVVVGVSAIIRWICLWLLLHLNIFKTHHLWEQFSFILKTLYTL